MFGSNLLVCPVTKPMYYEAESRELKGVDKAISCYLPSGCDWYDIRDNKKYEGGQTVAVKAEIDSIPVFAGSGSIIPMRQGLTYAMEDNESPLEIHVYTGRDGDFTFYDDAGDDYKYEQGEYERIRLHWSDKDRKLRISGREGSFRTMKENRRIKIFLNGERQNELEYTGSEINIKV